MRMSLFLTGGMQIVLQMVGLLSHGQDWGNVTLTCLLLGKKVSFMPVSTLIYHWFNALPNEHAKWHKNTRHMTNVHAAFDLWLNNNEEKSSVLVKCTPCTWLDIRNSCDWKEGNADITLCTPELNLLTETVKKIFLNNLFFQEMLKADI